MPRVSIITSVYHGNQYLNGYLKKMSETCKGFKADEIEVIWINDSPESKIDYDKKLVNGFSLRIIDNEKNVGIHQSRVNGLKFAQGEYVIFLDQDDFLLPGAIMQEWKVAQEKKANWVLSNGIMEGKNQNVKIFGNKFSQRFATRKKNYLLIKDFIVSPGQTMIKKEAIPDSWQKNIMMVNGCDDYLLWLLMFNDGKVPVCNYETAYRHHFTDNNLSDDEEWMKKSQLEMLKILKNDVEYSRKDYKTLERVLKYKHIYHQKFLRPTIVNFDIFLYNCFYRLVWRGYKVRIFR